MKSFFCYYTTMVFARHQQKMQRWKLAGANHNQTKSFWKRNCKTHTSLAGLSNLTQSLHANQRPTRNPPTAARDLDRPTRLRPNPKQAHRSHRDETDCATPRRRPRQRRPHPRLSNPMCSLLLPPALPKTTATLQTRSTFPLPVLLQPGGAPQNAVAVQLVHPRVHGPGPDVLPGELDCEAQ